MTQQLLVNKIIDQFEFKYRNQTIKVYSGKDVIPLTYYDLYRMIHRFGNYIKNNCTGRIGTLCENHEYHLALSFSISCSGQCVCPINPRLSEDQLIHIISRSGISTLFYDPVYDRVINNLKDKVNASFLASQSTKSVTWICMDQSFKDMISSLSDKCEWPVFTETQDCILFYTSGTTGMPKPSMYSHRDMILHTYASVLPDATGLSKKDRVLFVVNLYHVNAWGTAYTAPFVGSDLVLYTGQFNPKLVSEIIEKESITFSCGVPTVWSSLVLYLKHNKPQELKNSLRVDIGGSYCPRELIQDLKNYNINVIVDYGITESGPNIYMTTDHDTSVLGYPFYGVEVRVVDEKGIELIPTPLPTVEGKVPQSDPYSGNVELRSDPIKGSLQIRGLWISSTCPDTFCNEYTWVDTGDVAIQYADRTVQIVDRNKDMIKKGGEWISPRTIEEAVLKIEGVEGAVCVGVKDSHWGELPVLFAISSSKTTKQINRLLEDNNLEERYLPSKIILVKEFPLFSTGKIDKNALKLSLNTY